MGRLFPIVSAHERVVTVWEDSFTGGVRLPSSAIVHIWRDRSAVAPAIAAGHRVVISNAGRDSSTDGVYLDCGAGNWVTGGPRCLVL